MQKSLHFDYATDIPSRSSLPRPRSSLNGVNFRYAALQGPADKGPALKGPEI